MLVFGMREGTERVERNLFLPALSALSRRMVNSCGASICRRFTMSTSPSFSGRMDNKGRELQVLPCLASSQPASMRCFPSPSAMLVENVLAYIPFCCAFDFPSSRHSCPSAHKTLIIILWARSMNVFPTRASLAPAAARQMALWGWKSGSTHG